MRTPALLSLVSLLACSGGAPPQSPAPETAQLNRPPLDDRGYRLVMLENGMKVLLISDADTDTAAAALNVAVGQFSDPADREGLAHFLEHMLFMGTDVYPGVDEYKEFITTHGGGSNAGTGQENTNYYFTVEQAHLEGALDRFARFFVAPRLDPAQVERERNAVDSEYHLKIRDEARRIREVRRETSNPEHGFSQFSVGNLDTLADREGDAVWDDLKAFYESEYSASRMTLSVLGREDLDTLEQWVRERFAAVPTTGAPPAAETAPAYLDSQLGVQISWTPITDKRELRIELPVPTWEEHFREKPQSLPSYLLGQEGEGSLHAALTARGWITALYAGLDGSQDHGLLTVTTQLTEAGYENLDAVISLHFQYIRLIQQTDDLSPWWNERKALSELGFAFAEPPAPRDAVNGAVSNLQTYPPEHVLDAWATWEHYDPALQARFLADLTPDKARIFVAGPGLETDQVEPLYDVPWSMRPLAPERITAWETAPIDPDLSLPPLNPYIAEDLALKPVDGDVGVPAHIVDEPGLSVWHLQDPSFGVPRAALRATLTAPGAAGSQDARLKAMMLVSVLKDAMNTDLDQLKAAGLSISLSADDEGLWLQIAGYNDKQDVALDRVLAVLAERPIDPERFAVLRDDQIRRWRNTTQQRPNTQAGWVKSWVVHPGSDPVLEAADALEQLTAEQLQAFSAELFSALSVEVLVHGNHTAAEAEALARRIPAALASGAPPAPRPPVELLRLPEAPLTVDYTVDHDDSALRVYYQGQQTDLDEQARYLLLSNLMETPFFSSLRTEQQLGYIVFAAYAREDWLPGIQLGVQSSQADAQTLLARVDAFLVDFETLLDEMDAETFAASRDALVIILREAPDSLYDRTGDLGRDLSLGVTTFDRKEQIAQRIAGLTLDEVRAFYRERVLPEGTPRLVVRAIGHAHAGVSFAQPGLSSVEAAREQMGPTYTRER